MDSKIEDDREFKRVKRRGRLIIRNLPFKVNEESIRHKFEKFGQLTDVSIPLSGDGKVRGFAFINYLKRTDACKAVKAMSGTKFGGRVIAVDHSVPKKFYVTCDNLGVEDDDKVKKENRDGEIVNKLFNKVIKSEEKINTTNTSIKEENNHDSDDDNQHDHLENDQDIESINSANLHENLSDENVDDNLSQTTSQGERKARKRQSRDAKEGRTIFVKSLSFDTTKEALKAFFDTFGPIEYCLLCRDPEFDYPKGTAFVKFKNKDDAEKCLSEYQNNIDRFILDNRNFEVYLALTRGAVTKIQEQKRAKHRDKRNIYLAKEGLIYPDSPAAEGMSQSDLTKRLQLEMRKRSMLNNCLNFVSRNRLCVHNLPEELSDGKLKKIFLNAVNNTKAKITESKIIRNVKGKGQTKLGKSSGYGFVTFTRHCDALKALRVVNNNPNIFRESKRPVVEFSIEKVTAVKKKRNNNDHHYDEDTNLTEEDIEDDIDSPYMGVKASPFKDHEPIVLPKINRKMFENWEKLKERGKRLKKEKNIKKFSQAKMIGRIKKAREKKKAISGKLNINK